IAYHLFREAFNCLKSNARFSTWITEFLLPWAENIILTPTVAVTGSGKVASPDGSSEQSASSGVPTKPKGVSFVDASANTQSSSQSRQGRTLIVASSSHGLAAVGVARMQQLNVHISTNFLVQLFTATSTGIIPLSQALPLWKRLVAILLNV